MTPCFHLSVVKLCESQNTPPGVQRQEVQFFYGWVATLMASTASLRSQSSFFISLQNPQHEWKFINAREANNAPEKHRKLQHCRKKDPHCPHKQRRTTINAKDGVGPVRSQCVYLLRKSINQALGVNWKLTQLTPKPCFIWVGVKTATGWSSPMTWTYSKMTTARFIGIRVSVQSDWLTAV